MQLIYEKYKNDLLALAIALSNDKASAEDIVHDVFVAFAQLAGKLQLQENLKSYLSTSVANRVRNSSRKKAKLTLDLDGVVYIYSSYPSSGPPLEKTGIISLNCNLECVIK